MLKLNKILFNQAGSGQGGGGGNSAGGNKSGDGQSGQNSGNSGDAGAGGKAAQGNANGQSGGAKDELFSDGGNKAADDKGGQQGAQDGQNSKQQEASKGASGVVFPDNWKDGLPDDLKNDGSMGPIKDIPTLVKSYINAQKLIGADKVPVPGKHATEAEWTEAMHKLGNPRTLEEYGLEIPKDSPIEKEFMDKFKVQAHKLGILPKQAQPLLAWMGQLQKDVWDQADKEHTARLNADMGALRQEWGDAHEGNILKAKAAINEFADANTKKYMQDSGLGKSASFIRFMAKVGETLSEDKIRGGGGNQGMLGSMTPAQAQGKIKEINESPRHPYWDKNHENHKAANTEMETLYKQAYPGKK